MLFSFRRSIFLLLVTGSLHATPQITEFSAINRGSLVDGDGKTPDWIEIFNPDPDPLDLNGYHLTDNPEIPGKYTFPPGTVIPPGGYLVVCASNQGDSSYIDPLGYRHTNFSLTSEGEYLALASPDGEILQAFAPAFPEQRAGFTYGTGTSTTTASLVDPGAPCRWLVPERASDGTWREPAFDDSAWNPATTGIGYGYEDEIGSGGETRSAMWFSSASVYLRVPFEVEDPSAFSSLTLRMRYEDGFVAYLNGERMAAANAPDEASLSFDSTATAGHPDAEAVIPQLFTLPPGPLVAGSNVLAFHGLNLSASGANSSDFLLLPELAGTETETTGSFGYFQDATPGAPNRSIPLEGFVADTKFSTDRGYHQTPFDLVIRSATPGAEIFFTTDGTPPSPGNGTRYTGPIRIDSTTTIRAMATREGFEPTNIDTQTYLFVDDVIRQTRPPGYPASWAGAPSDYDMDPDIVDHPDYAGKFADAFAALPTLSLVFAPDSFFDPATGIYQRPQSEGSAWERPLSAEFIVTDQSEPGFQIDAGVRIQGGSSRNPDTPKHSLSLRFRAQYGEAKLRYPLYRNSPVGETAVEVFDLLQLRPEYNYGWMHRHWYQADHALYGRDQWASDLYNAMGQNGSHGRWVHLFLNGIYWGVYDLHERPDADHLANYFGGEQDDYDTVNSSVATHGDLTAFNTMMNLAYGSIQTAAVYEEIQQYLDLDAFADYMILNAYVGNRDWDGHNWRAGRRRQPGAPYLFFPWDTEFAVSHVSGGVFPNPPDFFSTSLNTNVTGRNGNRRPTGLQNRLQLNAEYRMRYADRVQRHFFHDGPLVPERATALWTARSDRMRTAIVAESARWGDFRRDVNPGRWRSSDFDLYTRDDHYLPLHEWLVDTYLPQRSEIVLNQLRSRNLFPSTAAPVFSPRGGNLTHGQPVTLEAPGTIHLTTDGSDPRLPGGTPNPAATTLSTGASLALTQSAHLKARTRASNGEWSALSETTFSIETSNLVITEIMYHPAGNPLAEFLEITNTGEFEISFTALSFNDGIVFDFDQHATISLLAPGERILIVRDLSAFQSVYGSNFDSLIAGVFQEGTALNNAGETVTLSDAGGNEVFSVTYRDSPPWPTEADWAGHSLVFTGGDPALAVNWRASTAAGGHPGTSDAIPFTGDSLIDYSLVKHPSLLTGANESLLTWVTRLGSDHADFVVSHSYNLKNWAALPTLIRSQTIDPVAGTRTLVMPLPPGARGFARITVRSR